MKKLCLPIFYHYHNTMDFFPREDNFTSKTYFLRLCR